MNNHETFEDLKIDVRKRVQDAIEDEKTELRKKITVYYLEHNDIDWLNMFEDWLYKTQSYIAEDLSMYYYQAWNIVHLARFAEGEDYNEYYWEAVDLVEHNAAVEGMKDFDDLMTMVCFHLVDAIARDELNEQLQPFVSGVIETLQAK